MDLIEYEYWTGETEVMEYTRELQDTLPDPSKFPVLFDCFLNKKMSALADIMVSMLKSGVRYKNMVVEKDAEIERLKKQIAEKENRISELLNAVNDLGAQCCGTDMQDMMKMKALYEQGYSLRKLGEIFNCDKSTVKRRLIKMGVSFD